MGFLEDFKKNIGKKADSPDKTGEKAPDKTGEKGPDKTGEKKPEKTGPNPPDKPNTGEKKEKLNPWGGKAGTWEVPALKKPGAMESKMKEIRKNKPDSTETKGERERDLHAERRAERTHEHGAR